MNDDSDDDASSDTSEDSDVERNASRRTACIALLVLFAGLLLAAESFCGLNSKSIEYIDHLAVFNAVWPTYGQHGVWQTVVSDLVPTLTTRRVLKTLLLAGFAVAVIAVIGIVGAATRHKSLVCTYVLLACSLSGFSLAVAAQTLERRAVAVPLIHRQVLDLCNATRYFRLGAEIACPWAVSARTSEASPCNQVCKFRAKVLEHLNGCELLPNLCGKFSYEQASTNACRDLVANAKSAYISAFAPGRCKAACDADVKCKLFGYEETWGHCLLLSAQENQHKTPQWTPLRREDILERYGPNGREALNCFQKSIPLVLDEFEKQGLYLAISTAILGCLVFASSLCSCCLMYDVNMKRPREPNGMQLMVMMLFPHCTQRMQDKFYNEKRFGRDLENQFGYAKAM